MKKRKCQHINLETKYSCKVDSFAPVKVDLIHSDTGRKSKQTWYFCERHFYLFMKTEGEGWEAVYRKKPNKRAIVIGYQIVDCL